MSPLGHTDIDPNQFEFKIALERRTPGAHTEKSRYRIAIVHLYDIMLSK